MPAPVTPTPDPVTGDTTHQNADGDERADSKGAPIGDTQVEATEVAGDRDPAMQEYSRQGSHDVDMGYIGCLMPDREDTVSELMLQTLVSSGRSYARERRAACRRIVTEVYSPPSVTAEITRLKHPNFVAGLAFVITTVDPDDGEPWGFSLRSKREKARRKCAEQQPCMLI